MHQTAQFICTLFALFPLIAQAADSTSGVTVTAPVLGLVSSQSAPQIRPLLGIPGAAHLGSPIAFSGTLKRIDPAPGSSYALAVVDDRLTVFTLEALLAASSESPAGTAIDEASPCADLVAFSPLASAAAVYCQSASTIEVFTGLPASPKLATRFPSTALPAGKLALLALSDDAGSVLAAAADGAACRLTDDAAPAALEGSTRASAIAFLRGSSQALVADAASRALWLHTLTGESGSRQLFQDSEDAAPVTALAAAADSTRAYLLSAGAVRSLNLSSGEVTTLALPSEANRLARLAASDLYLYSFSEGAPLRLFNGLSDPPATSAVPAADASL
jgi:hypothetical protein